MNDNVSLLPSLESANTLPHIDNITGSFSLPRNVIASAEEISFAWRDLPRELKAIPEELRNEFIARMCIATSVGLFDGAINYIWNATIVVLRNKVRNFGFSYISQTQGRTFEEKHLAEMTDHGLIELCEKLELISEEGYFFLDQCREVRNNFSTAHPSIANIDDRELITFISRCCKYGLTNDHSTKGINVPEFIDSLKLRKWDGVQLGERTSQLKETFNAQKQLIVPMLHTMYCDSTQNEETRVNCLSLSKELIVDFDEKIKSEIVDRHNSYKLKGQNDKVIASQTFLERLGLTSLLANTERHSIIKTACTRLMDAHRGWDNFYNEVPFAERLHELVVTNQMDIPATAQQEFVVAVVSCYAGNSYGTSQGASYYYSSMIKNFSPKEVDIMLRLNLSFFTGRRGTMYRQAVNLIDESTISPSNKSLYESRKR